MTRSSARTPAPVEGTTDEAKTYTVYNSTDGPLPYDRAGRMIPARGTVDVADVTGSPLAGHVKAERFVVLNPDDAGDAAAADPQPESVDTDVQTQEA